jgi:hypothetical protein
MTSRIYHVEMYRNGDEAINHLVRATSKAAAAKHVLDNYGTVALADQETLVRWAGSVPVETAGEQDLAPSSTE